jgi:hypothetical protein
MGFVGRPEDWSLAGSPDTRSAAVSASENWVTCRELAEGMCLGYLRAVGDVLRGLRGWFDRRVG